MNALKTTLLLGALSGLLLLGGQALGGRSGLMMGLVLAIGMNFISYFFSEKIALMSHGAQRLSETEHSDIYWRVAPLTKRLADRMGLPMPKLWVIPEQSPNAFATGRNPQHSSVAVTHGLLGIMNERELEAVIGHELGHIKNRDILISSIAATLASAITFVARMAFFFGPRSDDDEGGSPIAGILMLFLAPIAAMLIQMAISRTREFGADAAAAKAMETPEPMIGALQRLEGWSKQIPMESASPAQAHMYIIKPFSAGGMLKLFSTHPPTEERIARLRSLRAA